MNYINVTIRIPEEYHTKLKVLSSVNRIGYQKLIESLYKKEIDENSEKLALVNDEIAAASERNKGTF